MSSVSHGLRRMVFAAWFCALPLGASAQTVAYVTAGDQILAVRASGPAAVVHTSSCGLLSGDLTFGADGLLYFAEPGCLAVSRVNPAAQVTRGLNASYQRLFSTPAGAAQPGAATEIRLTAELDVLFNTQSTGVWKLARSTFAPSQVIGSGGAGLAIAHNGSITYVDGTQVKQHPSPATFAPFTATGAVGLGVTNGGAGTAIKLAGGAPKLPTSTICYSSANTIRCANKTGSGNALYAAFPTAQQVRYFEFLSDDTALVATSENPAIGTTSPNGRLYRVDGAGASLIYTVPKVGGRHQPLNGVASLPSDQSITEAGAASGLRLFDFGDFEVRVSTPAACRLSVTASQTSIAAAQALLNLLDTSGTHNVYLTAPLRGEESHRTRVDVAVVGGACGSPVTLFMAGFFDESVGHTWALSHFSFSGNQVTEAEVITDGFFPFAAPDDPGVRGSTDDFSSFLPALVQSAGNQATFCGFGSPLNNNAQVPPLEGAEQHATNVNLGSKINVKFQVSTGNCSGNFVVDFADYPRRGAVLAVMRLADGKTYTIRPPGSANEPPVFRIDSDGITHLFNLDTTPTAEAPWQRGIHVLTVFSLDGLFPPASILINIK